MQPALVCSSGECGQYRTAQSGRYLFPDRLIVAKDLVTQLDIRVARQTLIKALRGKPNVDECARLIEEYFDKLLAWNQQTGWEKNDPHGNLDTTDLRAG